MILVFFVWPGLESMRLAFYRTSPFGDRLMFVGIENFTKLLGSEGIFGASWPAGSSQAE